MSYRPRVVDQELSSRLASAGAVVVEGPKACGKTETARQISASEVFLDTDLAARQAMSIDPGLVLGGEHPRLLDEWQVEPKLWNYVRRAVDERKAPGQFILTGSAVPPDDVTRHTGAGRFSRLRMRPMSLFETGHSDASISLARVLEGSAVQSAESGLQIRDLAECVTVGGWPALQELTVSQAANAVVDYLDQIQRTDVARVDGRHRDPIKLERLIRSLARNTATEVARTTLAADVDGKNNTLSHHTVSEYLDALERLMIVEPQPTWAPQLRSKATLRNVPKQHLADPSLAVAALRATPERLLNDLNFFGFLFESLVVRDLRVYAQAVGGRVFHYRDSSGLEVDAVVETNDGRWAAFEIKLGVGSIDHAARSLKKLEQQVSQENIGAPVRLGVIVSTGYGYVRDDGIAVIPIGTLGP